jgi:S-DNA-T family DNA segregation ATPase FtsK/SpoIIIE
MPDSGLTITATERTRPLNAAALRLVSLVAIERVRAAVRKSQNECVRFSVVGFDAATNFLLQALADAGLNAAVWASDVWQTPAGGAVQSTDEPPGHFRDLPPPADVRAIIFAPSVDEIRNNKATMGTVARLAPDVLKQDIDLWIEVADQSNSLTSDERRYFRMVLQGLVGTEILTRIETLGAFVAALSEHWTTRPPHQAVAEALPAIRIPRGAGKFKAPGARGAPRAAKSWASELQDLHNRATDLAFLRNDRAQPLDRVEIRERCDDLEAQGEITADDARVIRELLDDQDIMPGTWRPSQAAIIGLEWSTLQRVFRTPKSKSKASINEETAKFFELYEPNALDDEDRALLALVDETRPATAEEKNFFERVRTLMRQDRAIFKRWERFAFARAREHSDLLVGLLAATLEILPDLQAETILVIRAPGSERLSFWEDHALELGLLLRDRYRGLGEALGPRILVEFGHCWITNWEAKMPSGQKPSRDAYQMKFELHAMLPADIGLDGHPTQEALTERPRRQFVWAPSPHSLQLAFSANLNTLRCGDGGAELLSGRYARTVKGARMRPLPVNLANTRSFVDTEDSASGILFNPNDAPLNIGRRLGDGLKRLRSDGAISKADEEAVRAALTAFEKSYSSAIGAFSAEGIGSPHLLDQAERFGELLQALRQYANNDASREILWRPLALIGLAIPRNGAPGAIMTPFAPFRLAEVGLKARALGEILTDLLANPGRPGSDDFLTQASDDLAHPWFSDVAIVPFGDAYDLMSEQVTEGDFGLFEPVEAKDNTEQPDAYSREAAQRLLEASLEYLDLHPYDAANFSLALYNGQSREMPGLMAELLGKRIEDDNELRCDLIVTHDDRSELRRIYTEQNIAIGRELDAVTADSGRSFLSRLRVGFLDSTALSHASGGRPGLDIAFLQNAIGRHAILTWRPSQAPAGGWPALNTGLRGNSSRRIAPDPGQRATRVLLCAPNRPRAFQSYLNFARAWFEDAATGSLSTDSEPLKSVSYDHPKVKPVIAKAHEAADWIVTFDPVADRQLFAYNDISIISFAPSRSSRNNLIISTRAHGQALKTRLQTVLATILNQTLDQVSALASRLIAEAADLSGRIVLRAANNHLNALELVGVVLGHHLTIQALEPAALATWLFVDDLKSALGHVTGDEVADLVAIALNEQDGQALVELVAIEAKFVDAAGKEGDADRSASQLASTLHRLETRFGAGADDLNRSAHLARLADLMIEHGKRPRVGEDYILKDWAERIRRGEVTVRVRGLSTVFLHDGEGETEPRRSLSDSSGQYIFNRPAIARMLESLQADGPLAAPRVSLGGGANSDVAAATDASSEATNKDTSQAPATDASGSAPAASSETSAPIDAAELHPEPSESSPTLISGFRPALAALLQAQPVAPAEIEGESWMTATIKSLQAALRGYGMTSEVIGSRLTPNAALVRLRGSEKMTVALVEKRRETLLTSHGLDVVAVRPTKGEVIVMIARDHRVILPTLDIWRRRALPPSSPHSNTSFILGEREDNGEILYLNLAGPFAGQPQHAPHTLIAGESGGGKGVFTANLLLDICATNSPENARIQLVDPKAGLDYGWIEQVPHLDGGIITTPEEATTALEALVAEMERRYTEVLAVHKVPNIDVFNATAPASERLPRIYFFHDELADWMDDSLGYIDAVTTYVKRLSAKARAAGIHLFIITQRPDKDALPGAIKANIGNKIALKVSNRLNSQIILDETGAEGLLGHGHMIAKLANQPGGLVYAQAPYLSADGAYAAAAAIATD